jgi:hypothetical protein
MRICNITCTQSRCRQGIWRNRDKPPYILNLGTWYKCVIGFNPQPICSRYPVNMKHCGAQNLCVQLGEHKHLLSLPKIELLFLSSYLSSPQHTHYTNWATLVLVPSYTATKQHDDDVHFPFFLSLSSHRVGSDTNFTITANTTIWTLCVHLTATCFGLHLSIFFRSCYSKYTWWRPKQKVETSCGRSTDIEHLPCLVSDLHKKSLTSMEYIAIQNRIYRVIKKVSVHLIITVHKTSKLGVFELSPHNWWFEDGHHRIHSECGPCYTEHGLREHSSACQ